jgi:hypothetical protein
LSIAILSEMSAKLLSRTLDSHLQGGHTDTGELCHVLVASILDEPEQKSLSRIGGKSHQRPLHIDLPLELRGIWRRGGARLDIERNEGALAPPLLRPNGSALVQQNPEHPWTKLRTLLVPSKGTVGADAGILHRFLGVEPVPEHAHGIPKHARVVPLDEEAKGGFVTVAGLVNERVVLGLHDEGNFAIT